MHGPPPEGHAAPVPPALTTPHLRLPALDAATVTAVAEGRRLPGWAEDFPQEGDVDISTILARDGLPSGADAVFGSLAVVEASTRLTIGTIGFFGPPRDGVVEIGYGIVPSRQRRGYATEAVAALLVHATAQPGVREVIAHAEVENIASRRVLEKNGLTYTGREGTLVRYALTV